MATLCTLATLVGFVWMIWSAIKRAFAGGARAPHASATTVVLSGGETINVVGESHYQHALERIAGGRTSKGSRMSVVAALVPEPTNRFDANAVAVFIRGSLVGYLSREDAIAFKPLLAEVAARGEVATCAALVVGGWDRGARGQGSFGVKLNLAYPGKPRTEQDHLEEALDKLESAKGPAGRRAALGGALEVLRSPEMRSRLMVEASRIEVEAVLDKVEELKTPGAKRRRLVEALEAIKADAVPDELQAEQVRWLEEALRNLDAPGVAKRPAETGDSGRNSERRPEQMPRVEPGSAGLVGGRHYSEWASTLREWRQQERFEEAEALGLELLEAAEAEARAVDWAVAPAYYEELAKLYKTQRRFEDEVAILERYLRQPNSSQAAAPGSLAERLEKARGRVARARAQ